MASSSRRGPWIEDQHGSWTLRILAGEEPVGGLVDVEAEDATRRLVGTIGSLASIKQVMSRYQESGECLSGRYFWAAGLVVVDKTTEGVVFDVLRHLLDTGEAFTAFEEVRDDA